MSGDDDNLQWGGDGWETRVVIKYFRGCGENIDVIDAPRRDFFLAADERAKFKVKKIDRWKTAEPKALV